MIRESGLRTRQPCNLRGSKGSQQTSQKISMAPATRLRTARRVIEQKGKGGKGSVGFASSSLQGCKNHLKISTHKNPENREACGVTQSVNRREVMLKKGFLHNQRGQLATLTQQVTAQKWPVEHANNRNSKKGFTGKAYGRSAFETLVAPWPKYGIPGQCSSRGSFHQYCTVGERLKTA